MPQHSDIATILAATDTAPQVIEGVLLDDLWVTSGDTFEDDHVDLLLHLDDGSVNRARVFGTEAQVVAGRYGRGDRVRAVIHGKAREADVFIVDEVEAADP